MKWVLRPPWVASRHNGEIEMRNELLASIVATSNDAILSYSLDRNITSWNPAAKRIFGYSADEMIGQPFSVLVPSEKASEAVDFQERLERGEIISNYETVRLRKDGSTVPISLTLSLIHDPTGAVIGGSSIYRDITDLKVLESQEALLAAIVTSSNDAIISETVDGIIASWNSAAERMYGYLADEMIGQSVSVLFHPDHPDEVGGILQTLRNGQGVAQYETVRIKKDGSTFPVSVAISPIYDLTGVVIGGSSIYRDLTEIKKSEAHNEMLALIVESSNEAIWSWTLDGIVTVWNPAAERIFGYLASELIGQIALDMYPPDKLDETVELIDKTRSGQPVTNFETVRLRKDGSAIPVSLTISPIYDLTGAVIGGASIYRDLTELKRAEQKFHTIVESAPDAMVIVDETGTINIVNAQTEKLFGYSRDEMLGQPVEMLIPSRFQAKDPALRDNYIAHFRDRRRGFAGGRNLCGRGKDGREFPMEVSLSPIDTADGTLIVATIRDVTVHKNIVRRLKEMNELRSEFVAVVAHDLRSPMTSISGFAKELLNEWDATDDAKKIEYLQIIVRNTDHLAEFVEEVLQVARIEAGEYTYDIRSFDIRLLVQRALDETASAYEDRRFEFFAPEDFPAVRGDEDRQWQVLTNLLSNAVKFSPAEEPIVVGLSCIDDSVQVTVTDRGIGIATDDLPKLFTKFGRVSNPGLLKAPGNGLGLYICKTLVEAQGGRIWCESSPGRGSTFIFTIPVAR